MEGNFAGAFPENKYTMNVTEVCHLLLLRSYPFDRRVLQGKKYLLRIINTSVDTTYVFSIDNHNFTVMTTDFVPIVPYNVSHIVVGIGRY